MTNIILCGGSGTRLWPISRALMPKQFVKLFAHKSLFQLTVERNSKICDSQLIVSNTEQYFLALDQLEELEKTNDKYLLEPIARNTAPAIALACMSLKSEELVLVTPSDHLIKNETAYKKVIEKAKELALTNNLVTFGITPTFSETGFGYIEAESSSFKCAGLNVKKFHEKPNFEIANKYLEQNSKLIIQNLPLKFFWNSGMFMFKAGVFLKELKKHSPTIYETSFQAYKSSKNENNLTRVNHEDMANIPEDSIDYAVMEKSDRVKVIPSNINWSDVGSFDSLYEELEKDKNNNTLNSNHISIDSKNNLIISQKQVATIDLEDFIVVDTADALLISKKGSSQKVKEIVKELKTKNSELINIHLTGNRPWGTYTVLQDKKGYKIKKIIVNPGKRLSLQKHFHRNEHWIVVSGSATVTIEDKNFTLNPNESTYIKAGQIHRLANNTNVLLVIIEVQVGSYTGEDDIVRIDDDFKRNEDKVSQRNGK